MVSAASAHTNEDWFGTQRQYWDALLEQQRKFFAASTDTASAGMHNIWADFFKEWQSAVSGTECGSSAKNFQQQFTQAGEQFFTMMQHFYQSAGQAKPFDQAAQEWTETLQKFYTEACKNYTKTFDPAGFDPQTAFAAMPGLGYTREKQDQMNLLFQRWMDYMKKSRAYDAGMAQVGLEAILKFQEYIANPMPDDEPVASLKDIYGRWVDACEEVYAGYAMSDEYIQRYGDTVNALMAFKQQQNKLVDEMIEQFNLPTRQEVDSLHQRMQALRREVAELKAALKTAAAPAPKKPAKKGKKS